MEITSQPQNHPKPKTESPKAGSAPMKFWKDEKGELTATWDQKGPEHPLNLVTGCKDLELSSEIFGSALDAIAKTMQSQETAMNVMLQALHDFKPQNAIEARLAAQAAVCYRYAMRSISKFGDANLLPHIEAMGNMAIKLMRVHNETVEALNRCRRGGEQRVTVTHIAGKMAVVNNFGPQGGGGIHKNKGDSPCSQQSVMQKPEEMTISPVDNPQWQTGNADCTAEKAQDLRRKKAG